MDSLRRLRARLALRTRLITGLRRVLALLGDDLGPPPDPAPSPEPVPHPAPAPAPTLPTSTEVLQAVGAQLDLDGRVALTVSCRDTEALAKVDGAGQVFDGPHGPVQRMHNGIEVVHRGYFGDWMASIIETLRGHHEPQEELVFARVLERVEGPAPVMIELGCYWAYYSCWFAAQVNGAVVVACEPDPDHLDIGRRNAEINGLGLSFEQCASGPRDGDILELPSVLREGVVHEIPVRTVPTVVADHDLEGVDVLQLDIQGAELGVLESCGELIAEGRLRFVVISTHHHTISGDARTHQRCLEMIHDLGGHVIAEHTVLESFSGDGLIAASFDDRDRHFTVDLSRARTIGSLFPSGEDELARFAHAYDELRCRVSSDPAGS